jgi:chromosomal replication initiator protein
MGINLEINSSGKSGAALQTSAVWNDEARLVEQWTRVRARLQAEVGEVEYRTWLKQVSFAGLAGDEVVVMLPTRFLRDWVNKEYGELIAAFWQQENQSVRRVEFRTGAPAARPAVPDLAEPAPAAAFAAPQRQRPENIAALDQRFTFETFVVGKPNEFAYACARRVAEAPATAGFNPLFLYGGVGLGKTHLMHAIAWELSKQV